MIKRSVDDLELFNDQRRKSARIILFLSSPWSGFRHLSTACKSDDLRDGPLHKLWGGGGDGKIRAAGICFWF